VDGLFDAKECRLELLSNKDNALALMDYQYGRKKRVASGEEASIENVGIA
jgi:hypothetical protein